MLKNLLPAKSILQISIIRTTATIFFVNSDSCYGECSTHFISGTAFVTVMAEWKWLDEVGTGVQSRGSG